MQKKYLLLFVILINSTICFSQDTSYVRQVMLELGSAQYNGRGYGLNGNKIAANFIKKELQKSDIQSFNNSYFQEFNINVNTFTGNNNMKINETNFEPGKDFLITPFSNSVKGTFEGVTLDAKIITNKRKLKRFLKQNYSSKFIIVDTLGLNDNDFAKFLPSICQENELGARGIIQISDKKLIHTAAQEQKNFVHITLLRTKYVPKKHQKITLNIDAKFLPNYRTQNVLGYIKGKTDSFIVFSAHYDHLGNMGKNVYFPGGNDNASGTAFLLDFAKKLTSRNEKPHYSIVFLFFVGEELGLLGSRYFTQHPIFPLSKIKFLTNLDMVGSGDKGIQIVNGSVFKDKFDFLVTKNTEKNYLPKVKIRGTAANSDHYFFYEKGVPCFFIYTLGQYSEYHNIADKPKNVPLIGYNHLFLLINDFLNNFENNKF